MPLPVGVSFRETMGGSFAFGAVDPLQGASAGERAGTIAAIHAEVSIADFDRFEADPQHVGTLSGTLDLPGWGAAIPTTRGVFRLFSPGETPDLKLMVYELAFRHDERPHYLAGRKEIRNDAGPDLWSDTTTLLTRVHEGDDAGGRVAGAGVLLLGVGDLVRMVSTLQATGTTAPGEAVAVLSRFGGLFLGELWERYRVHVPRCGG